MEHYLTGITFKDNLPPRSERMTLKDICEMLELTAPKLATLTGIPYSAIRGYYYGGQEPAYSKGRRIIQALQVANMGKGAPVNPDHIADLWRNGRAA